MNHIQWLRFCPGGELCEHVPVHRLLCLHEALEVKRVGMQRYRCGW